MIKSYKRILRILIKTKPRVNYNKNWNEPKSIDEELLRDVISAVWILECEIKLIILIKHIETFLCFTSGTSFIAATEDTNNKIIVQYNNDVKLLL